MVRRIHRLSLAGESTGEILRQLHDDEALASLVPSRRTVYAIAQEAKPAADVADPNPKGWSFFAFDMPPEDARLVMDYYASLMSPAEAFGDPPRRPRRVRLDVARLYVRWRRAYPELSLSAAMDLAQVVPGEHEDYTTWSLAFEVRKILEEKR